LKEALKVPLLDAGGRLGLQNAEELVLEGPARRGAKRRVSAATAALTHREPRSGAKIRRGLTRTP